MPAIIEPVVPLDSEPDELPAELEDRVYAAWLESAPAERSVAIAALVEEHPEHADALRRAAAELERSGEILSPLGDRPPAERRVGPYVLGDVLGEGGFGTVYRAYQLAPVRRVIALKVLHGVKRSLRAAQRFELERDALASMSHPAIAQIYDAGTTGDGRPYIAMELVEGEPITRFADRNSLDIRSRLELLVEVCAGVAHAHRKGFVHRDLKPSNVLVRRTPNGPAAKIIDFGVAKLIDSPRTEAATVEGGLVGTPEYMSPEQASGAGVDTRTDVWALGTLLFELLTGDLPFGRERLTGRTIPEVVRVIAEAETRRPSAAIRDTTDVAAVARRRALEPAALLRLLQGELDWILQRALARSPDDRYQTATDLARDLQRHLRHQPVAARPPTRIYLLRKFIRRHRLTVAAGVAVIASLVVAAGGVIAGWIDATRARDRALASMNAANMAAGYGALELNRPREVVQRLDAVPAAARGWEWRYLASRLDESSRVVVDHAGLTWHDVVVVGSWMVAATGGLAVALAVDGDGVVAQRDDSGPSPRLAASPDGSRVVEVDQRGRVRILGVPSLDVERVVAEASAAGGSSIAWSRDGRWVAVGDNAGSCIVHPLDGGAAWRIGGLGHDVQCAFHPDDAVLACIGTTGEVHIVDLRTRSSRRVRPLLSPDRFDLPRALAAAPDGRDFVCVTTTGQVHCMDWDESALRWTVELGSERLSDAAITPRGVLVVGGFARPVASLLDRETGACLLRYDGHRSGIDGVAVAAGAGGAEFYTAGRDGTVRAWQLDQIEQPVVLPVGQGICDARFDAGCRLVTSSRYGTLRCWDPATATLLGEVETGRSAGLLASDPDNDRMFVAWPGRLELVDTPGLASIDVAFHDLIPVSVAYLAAARRVAIGTERVVVLFDTAPLREATRIEAGDGAIAVAAADGGRAFVTVDGGGRGAIRFDVGGRTMAVAAIPPAREVASPPSSDLAAATCIDHVVRVWDTRTGVVRQEIASPSAWGIDWSPDATRIATGCGDGVVRLLDSIHGLPVVSIPMPAGGSGGRFSADGRHLAAICGPLHGAASALVWSIR